MIELNNVAPDARMPANGYPALCTAAEYGHTEVVQYLVEKVGRCISDNIFIVTFNDFSPDKLIFVFLNCHYHKNDAVSTLAHFACT